MYFMLRHLMDHFPFTPQLLQIFLILCSIWTTTSSTGKDLMSGSCTAWGLLLNRQRRGWRPPRQSSSPFLSWLRRLSFRAGQRVSTPTPYCFCSIPSIHTVRPYRVGSLPGSRSDEAAVYSAPSRWETVKTDTDTQHPYELLVPLRYSQCSLSSTTTERRSLRSSWQKHPSCNYQGGSPCCLWRKPPEGASNFGGEEVRLGHQGVRSPSGLCSRRSFLCSWRADHERTLHCFVLLLFSLRFFLFLSFLSCFGNMSLSMEYVSVPWKHIYLDRWASL